MRRPSFMKKSVPDKVPTAEEMKKQLAEQIQKLDEELEEIKNTGLKGIKKCFAKCSCTIPPEIKEKIKELNEKKKKIESQLSKLTTRAVM
mmetsp:Transcript_21383/g.49144  ORF Transcript_21383/g.49144 Transcript_21383/m.49144 type:complete len:90 (+) Transcript_21383:154-423(+)|eukprot:CAMPEP_0119352638 /NCGR_PEP_ID=MMETSP1334-20130426/1915_1 /TAXON_ID=127549 /ORGANISM="Calcidiscus leptoporus, Strain RCC1130" /LENGTH=89 /DNA_ID=CAMNT_0007365731 /DNA_START=146 /DNA_END=415 /DNA_ORIENTATION=+